MPGFGLRDKMVVITGGGGALGSAFARGFADHGASLAILDFDLDNAKPTAARFPAEKVIKLNDKDINRAKELMKYKWFQKKEWQNEIKGMLSTGLKFELDALANKDFQYLTKTYLPKKLQDKDWLD